MSIHSDHVSLPVMIEMKLSYTDPRLNGAVRDFPGEGSEEDHFLAELRGVGIICSKVPGEGHLSGRRYCHVMLGGFATLVS